MGQVQHPGEILLRDFLEPMGLTPYRLAQNIGVHVRRVSELVRGNRRLTPDTAARLGLFFGVPPRWFLELQNRYDADQLMLDELREIVVPAPGLERFRITPAGAIPLTTGDGAASLDVVEVSEAFVERLRAQAALAATRPDRQVVQVSLPSGTPLLTGSE